MKCFRNFDYIYTLESASQKDGRHITQDDLSPIKNASIVFDQKEIKWVGKDSELPQEYQPLQHKDYSGQIMLPGLVDSHTHLVFAGDRSNEYAMRLAGADYEEIAKAGGGILSTVESTRKASESELFELGKFRVNNMLAKGISTIEIKSGYGLDIDSETKISKVIHKLKLHFKNKITIFNTFMAAHAIPKEYASSKGFVTNLVIPLMKEISQEGIIDAVDIFHEKGYFNDEDVELLFEEAIALGLERKMHADEFYNNKGAELAARFSCLSADHLLQTSATGAKALANSTTVATLLPGTGFFLGKKQANARMLLDAGAKVAIATDYNPGSCHFNDLFKIACMSAPTYKMNVGELICAITLNSSHALGLTNQGALLINNKPKFFISKTPSVEQLIYNWN